VLLERHLIRKAVEACAGRKSAAARRLGLSRQGLYRKIRRYGLLDLLPGAVGEAVGVANGALAYANADVNVNEDEDEGADRKPAAASAAAGSCPNGSSIRTAPWSSSTSVRSP
jgi:hypothetical protein